MSSKENKKIAEEVIAAIGGKENIVSLAHCATRLRIVVKDRKKVNEKALDKIDKNVCRCLCTNHPCFGCNRSFYGVARFINTTSSFKDDGNVS